MKDRSKEILKKGKEGLSWSPKTIYWGSWDLHGGEPWGTANAVRRYMRLTWVEKMAGIILTDLLAGFFEMAQAIYKNRSRREYAESFTSCFLNDEWRQPAKESQEFVMVGSTVTPSCCSFALLWKAAQQSFLQAWPFLSGPRCWLRKVYWPDLDGPG